jgi:hypothetical protein
MAHEEQNDPVAQSSTSKSPTTSTQHTADLSERAFISVSIYVFWANEKSALRRRAPGCSMVFQTTLIWGALHWLDFCVSRTFLEDSLAPMKPAAPLSFSGNSCCLLRLNIKNTKKNCLNHSHSSCCLLLLLLLFLLLLLTAASSSSLLLPPPFIAAKSYFAR